LSTRETNWNWKEKTTRNDLLRNNKATEGAGDDEDLIDESCNDVKSGCGWPGVFIGLQPAQKPRTRGQKQYRSQPVDDIRKSQKLSALARDPPSPLPAADAHNALSIKWDSGQSQSHDSPLASPRECDANYFFSIRNRHEKSLNFSRRRSKKVVIPSSFFKELYVFLLLSNGVWHHYYYYHHHHRSRHS
jgi:hypothetical protein